MTNKQKEFNYRKWIYSSKNKRASTDNVEESPEYLRVASFNIMAQVHSQKYHKDRCNDFYAKQRLPDIKKTLDAYNADVWMFQEAEEDFNRFLKTNCELDFIFTKKQTDNIATADGLCVAWNKKKFDCLISTGYRVCHPYSNLEGAYKYIDRNESPDFDPEYIKMIFPNEQEHNVDIQYFGMRSMPVYEHMESNDTIGNTPRNLKIPTSKRTRSNDKVLNAYKKSKSSKSTENIQGSDTGNLHINAECRRLLLEQCDDTESSSSGNVPFMDLTRIIPSDVGKNTYTESPHTPYVEGISPELGALGTSAKIPEFKSFNIPKELSKSPKSSTDCASENNVPDTNKDMDIMKFSESASNLDTVQSIDDIDVYTDVSNIVRIPSVEHDTEGSTLISHTVCAKLYLPEVKLCMTQTNQLVVLKLKDDLCRKFPVILIIGNCHLIYSTNAGCKKLMQIMRLMESVKNAKKYFQAMYPKAKIDILIGGDMNFTPNSMLYKMLMGLTSRSKLRQIDFCTISGQERMNDHKMIGIKQNNNGQPYNISHIRSTECDISDLNLQFDNSNYNDGDGKGIMDVEGSCIIAKYDKPYKGQPKKDFDAFNQYMKIKTGKKDPRVDDLDIGNFVSSTFIPHYSVHMLNRELQIESGEYKRIQIGILGIEPICSSWTKHQKGLVDYIFRHKDNSMAPWRFLGGPKSDTLTKNMPFYSDSPGYIGSDHFPVVCDFLL